MSYKICLDAGHGGKDPGACLGNRKESNDVLKMVLEVGKILSSSGIQVFYTRTSDIYDSPTAKAQKGNANDVDLFVSFHRNSSTNTAAKGIEVLVYNNLGNKITLSSNLCQRYQELGFVNRGVKPRTDLSVLNRTNMPAILLELGFISNISDNALFDSKFNSIVQATVDEIKKYFGIKSAPLPVVEKTGWIEQDGRWWWRNTDGSYPKNDWMELNGKWYYFGKDGWMHTGWLQYKDMWFYMSSTGAMCTGLQKIDGKLYFLNSEKGNTEGACMKTDDDGSLSIWKI